MTNQNNLYDVLSLMHERFDTFQTIWGIYTSIALGIIAVLISFPKHVYSITARIIMIIGFVIFAGANLDTLKFLHEERTAYAQEAKLIVSNENAGLDKDNYGPMHEMIVNKEIIETDKLRNFHLFMDVLIVLLIWILPKSLVDLFPYKTISKKEIKIRGSDLPNPIISWNTQNRIWVLEREELVKIPVSNEIVGIRIPKGFEFDLSTIPRFLWSFIAPFELSIIAPLVHDFIYINKGYLNVDEENFLTLNENYNKIKVSRRECDDIFLLHMKLEGIGIVKRRICYYGVRIFGYFFWKEF